LNQGHSQGFGRVFWGSLRWENTLDVAGPVETKNLSYHSIVPFEDNARAKPDIMAPQTASAIWPVI